MCPQPLGSLSLWRPAGDFECGFDEALATGTASREVPRWPAGVQERRSTVARAPADPELTDPPLPGLGRTELVLGLTEPLLLGPGLAVAAPSRRSARVRSDAVNVTVPREVTVTGAARPGAMI